MSALSPILRQAVGALVFWCPGCRGAHLLPVGGRDKAVPNWQWNGDAFRPTFTPSIMIQTRQPVPPAPDDPPHYICHSFVTNGQIRFLGDSTHDLAGATVSLPPFPGATPWVGSQE